MSKRAWYEKGLISSGFFKFACLFCLLGVLVGWLVLLLVWVWFCFFWGLWVVWGFFWGISLLYNKAVSGARDKFWKVLDLVCRGLRKVLPTVWDVTDIYYPVSQWFGRVPEYLICSCAIIIII